MTLYQRFIILIIGLLSMALSGMVSAAQHHFYAVHRLSEMKPYFELADHHTLILLDVDSTLTIPSDPDLRRQAIQQHKAIYDALLQPFKANQQRIFNHLLVATSPSQLLDRQWPKVIHDLQKKHSKVLAMTAAKMGPVGSVIPSFPAWRYQELKRMAIDFSSAFPGSVVFENLKDLGGDHPGMERGIVYCGYRASKGDLIQDVLKTLQWQPERIIFVDDKQDNIVSLSQALKIYFPNIAFTGIHYKAMEVLAGVPSNALRFKEKFSRLVQKTQAMCDD